MKVLKICLDKWNNASRDKRELSAYREMGAEVIVMAAGEDGDKGRIEIVDSFEVHRHSTSPLGSFFGLRLNRRIAIITWAIAARRYHADVISGHDIEGLMIGWLSSIMGGVKPQLIYDSHEFEAGRAAERSRIKSTMLILLERFLIRRCSFAIAVNDSIADEIQKLHKLKNRPVVVRSTPEKWTIDEEKVRATRQEICREMRWDNKVFIIMYHGMLDWVRNITGFLDIILRNNDLCGVLIGDFSSEEFEDYIKQYITDKGLEQRVYIHEAVPIEELYRYVGAADLETILLLPKYRSYYLCLPNKFFESIQSLTPLLTSGFPELKRLMDRYQIGQYVIPTDKDDIDSAIRAIKSDKTMYARMKKNLLIAKDELCWEKEKIRLQTAFADITQGKRVNTENENVYEMRHE